MCFSTAYYYFIKYQIYVSLILYKTVQSYQKHGSCKFIHIHGMPEVYYQAKVNFQGDSDSTVNMGST